MKDLRTALEAEDNDHMRSALDALNASMSKIGEAVYGAAGAGGSADGASADGGEAPRQDEGTVEGEFREV